MKIKVKAIHFNIGEELQAFIEKKLAKVEKLSDSITQVDVTLKVVKPETALNKNVALQLIAPGMELYVDKTANTFEEAVDQSVDVLKRQIKKSVEKRAGM